MPRFTYRDWVGRQARVLRLLRTKDHSVSYDPGDIVNITNYDRYLRFSVTDLEGQNFIWGVEPRSLQLLEAPLTLKKKITILLVQARLNGRAWLSPSSVALQVGEPRTSVARILKEMYLKDELMLLRGRVPLYSTNPQVLVPTRYDWLNADCVLG